LLGGEWHTIRFAGGRNEPKAVAELEQGASCGVLNRDASALGVWRAMVFERRAESMMYPGQQSKLDAQIRQHSVS
jgi:hypothetical protein